MKQFSRNPVVAPDEYWDRFNKRTVDIERQSKIFHKKDIRIKKEQNNITFNERLSDIIDSAPT